MTSRSLFAGAVPCGGSWFAVAFGPDGFDHGAVFTGVGDLWMRYEDAAERILLAIPVGLVESGDADRRCDVLARRVLGPRSDAVFTPPTREAARKRRHPAAERVNRRKTGESVSERAFAASDAITAVDELLQEVPEAQPVVAEARPEVCFRAFAGEPLSHPPEVAAGYAERLRTLAEFDPDAPPIVQAAAEATDGADVAVHDVLDAAALAYTARPGPGSLRSLPADPPTDAAGLPMRIVYRAETPLDE